MVKVNNDRIIIQLGANPFLLLDVLKLKKEKKQKLAYIKEPVNLSESIMQSTDTFRICTFTCLL